MAQGWKLATDAPKPEESTPGAERFRVVIEPRREAKLTVSATRAGSARIALGNISSAMIAQLAASGASAEELERAMRPIEAVTAQLLEFLGELRLHPAGGAFVQTESFA